jgi:hypothetical protein
LYQNYKFTPSEQEKISERSKLRKRFRSSNPGEGGSCNSETKHYRTQVLRIFSGEKIAGTQTASLKPVMVSISVEYVGFINNFFL